MRKLFWIYAASGFIKGLGFAAVGLAYGGGDLSWGRSTIIVLLSALGIAFLEICWFYLPRRKWHEEMLADDPDYPAKFESALAEKGWYRLFSSDWIRYRAHEFRKRRKSEE